MSKNYLHSIVFILGGIFMVCGCSEKSPIKQKHVEKNEVEYQSIDISSKDQLNSLMQKEIKEYEKMTPDELEKKQKQLKEHNAKTRSVALEELITRFKVIKKGASINAVEGAFDSVGKHQFTVQKEGRVYSCFSYFAGKKYLAKRDVIYYCLFESGKLFSISVPPPFEYDYKTKKNGTTRQIKKPVDPDKRIDQTFSANNMLDGGLVESFNNRFPKKSSSQNLGPIIGFMENFSLLLKKQKEEADLKRKKLEKKYNSSVVKLGMHESDVEAILGPPKHRHQKDGKTIQIYGEEATFHYHPYSFSWIAIEYENSNAVRVLTRDFLNEDN